MRTISLALVLAIAPMTAACSTAYQEAVPPVYQIGEISKITGQLTYRERMALPPGSTATVQLQDIARADAAATIVDEVRYSLTGRNVPFAFELELPNRDMPQNASYAVRATINGPDGKLLFTTDTVNPVMRRPVDQNLGEIVMVRAAR